MQFDVFANPIVAARKAYPYVVVLQSDATRGEGEEIVAPIAPRKSLSNAAGRLTPIVRIGSADYVDLVQEVSSLGAARGELLAAIDYLFFGI
jgi:hypothetical protein